MSLILALDGGGTKTDAALIDQRGQVVQRVQGAGCNPFDQPHWPEVLSELLAPLRGQFAGAGLGLPGYGEVPQVSAQQDGFAAALGVPTVTVNDVAAAHHGAFLGEAGVLILAGTGSMAWGHDSRGAQARAGGWGDLLGDEGSAYWVGLRALNGLTRALDSRAAPTLLHDRLRREIGAGPPAEGQALLAWVTGLPHPRSGIAALAQVVEQAAQEGDATARTLLQEAAGELLQLAQAVRRRLPQVGPHWSLAGGLTHSQTVRAALLEQLGAEQFRPARLPPLGGAALLAARRLGWPVSDGWLVALSDHLSRPSH